MSETTTSLPAPPINPESAPYWQACNEGRLLIKLCDDCGQSHFYPRDVCPHCLSTRTCWIEASGEARLYSFSRTPTKEGAYTLAYVRLKEGVTMMSNLVDVDPRSLAIDMPLKVVFVPTADGAQKVAMFRPVAA